MNFFQAAGEDICSRKDPIFHKSHAGLCLFRQNNIPRRPLFNKRQNYRPLSSLWMLPTSSFLLSQLRRIQPENCKKWKIQKWLKIPLGKKISLKGNFYLPRDLTFSFDQSWAPVVGICLDKAINSEDFQTLNTHTQHIPTHTPYTHVYRKTPTLMTRNILLTLWCYLVHYLCDGRLTICHPHPPWRVQKSSQLKDQWLP